MPFMYIFALKYIYLLVRTGANFLFILYKTIMLDRKNFKNSQSQFRIKTLPCYSQQTAQTAMEINLLKQQKLNRYDSSLYHKTNYHLRPLKDNPQFYVKVQPEGIADRMKKVDAKMAADLYKSPSKTDIVRNAPLPKNKEKYSKQELKKTGKFVFTGKERKKNMIELSQTKVNFNKMEQQQQTLVPSAGGNKSGINWLKTIKVSQDQLIKGGLGRRMEPNSHLLLPQAVNIREGLCHLKGKNQSLMKILSQDTKMLITAKKWIIFDMETNTTLKGYKHKKEHDIASLTKILTFYTAYSLIKKYYLSLDRFQMYVDEVDENIMGTKVKEMRNENLVTLEDMLYALMISSANNAATVIATNLGSLIQKKKQGNYFSCFDVPHENKEKNIETFLDLMNIHGKELGMESSCFVNVHGMCYNKSTAKDVALVTSQCYKIPLFCQMVLTKYRTIKLGYISENGEQASREVVLKNTNKLLWMNTGCIGGKTGCNVKGGESLAACYQGNIVVVVLGSAGRQQKFSDAEKLVGWLNTKISDYD